MTKLIIFASVAVVMFGASLWAYGMSYASIDITPNQEEIIATDKPTISVNWPYAVGANLKSAKVFLDGHDISTEIKMHSKGFTYKVPKKLPQGIHVINAKLTYSFFVKKKVNLKWFFTTDTVPPKIIMDERNDTLASRTPNLGLKAKTEPLTTIEAVFNKQKKVTVQSGKKGNFVVDLRGLKKKNTLFLKATDRAGNITKRNLKVIIDTKPPVVKPSGPNLIFSAENHSLKAALKDNESGILKANLLINGKPARFELDKEKDVIAHTKSFNKDGRYEAQVNAWDVAGNKATKKWTFVVDTSRIVINQSAFKLTLYKNDKVVHTLQVAVGQPGYPTPNGNWKVINKKTMPGWYNPGTSWAASMPKFIPPGPSNPLGLRALYLDAPGIRIHGTNAFYSIGRRASHGCIRVANPEIVKFFPKVRVGTPVLIKS